MQLKKIVVLVSKTIHKERELITYIYSYCNIKHSLANAINKLTESLYFIADFHYGTSN